jgi:hypothetical protein
MDMVLLYKQQSFLFVIIYLRINMKNLLYHSDGIEMIKALCRIKKKKGFEHKY